MEDILKCPECGGDNLHQYAAGIYHFGTSVEHEIWKGAPEVVINDSQWRNPSLRRNGILIGFYCENDCLLPDYGIYQHKGTTYMGWLRSNWFETGEVDVVALEHKCER